MSPIDTAAGVSPKEGCFKGAAGLRLLERAWLPERASRASIVLVHGYAEHIGRYEHVGQALASSGYAVHAFDLRGHGQSAGDRAIVRSFDAYLDDLDVFLARVHAAAPDVPVFLLGHSMGGAIVALHAIERRPEIRGIVLSGPAIMDTGGLATLLLRSIGRLIPRLPLVKLDAGAVSRDPDVVRRYDEDPLVYRGRVKAGMIAAMLDASSRIAARSRSFMVPLLVLHGREDRLASLSASEALVEQASSSDKTLTVYDGLYHEIFNEPERDRVLGDAIAWLDARS